MSLIDSVCESGKDTRLTKVLVENRYKRDGNRFIKSSLFRLFTIPTILGKFL